MATGDSSLPKVLRPSAFKIAVALGILAGALHFFTYADGHPEETAIGLLEAKALDAKFRVRGPIEPSGHVTVVAVDERAIAAYGRWPWERSVMALLVEALTEAGVRVIAVDMVFADPQTSGRHVVAEQAEALYREALSRPPREGEPPVGEGAESNPRRIVELEEFFETEVRLGNPDHRLAKAIFESGRFVWGLFGHTRTAGQAQLSDEHYQAAYERIEPFLVRSLYVTREVPDEWEPEKIVSRELPEERLSVGDEAFRIMQVDLGYEAPLPIFSAATPFFGAVDFDPDDDGVLRRADLLKRYRDRLVPSLALRAVAAYLNSHIYPQLSEIKEGRLGNIRLRVGSAAPEGLEITDAHGAFGWRDLRPESVEAGPWEAPHVEKWESWREERQAIQDDFPLDTPADELPPVDPTTLPGLAYDEPLDIPVDPYQHGRVMVNHIGPASAMDTVSAVDVINGEADFELLRGRVALVGVTAIGTFDQRVSPFDKIIPGVYVQASVIDGILSARLLKRQFWMVPLEIVLLVLIGLVVGLVAPRMTGTVPILIFVLVGGGLYLVVNQWLFASQGIDLFVVMPVATFLAASVAAVGFQLGIVDREKRAVKKAMGHYLAPSIMTAVLEKGVEALSPSRAEVSVLFSDIRGFTTISERLAPDQLAVVLNSYLTPMTDIVFEQEGTLDKYMGDAIMAFWGDPVPVEDHALRACRTAVDMIARCESLAEEFTERGWPEIEIGIGVNTGEVSAGNFGSDRIADYTVMGDAVNLASRLEGTNKQYGTKIIISEFCYQQVRDQVVVRELDAVRVKGKREPVRIFELMALGRPDEAQQRFLETFANALAHYKQQLWDDAIALFEQCVEQKPGDVPSQLYVARCHAMKEQPPGPDWDGVYTMTTK